MSTAAAPQRWQPQRLDHHLVEGEQAPDGARLLRGERLLAEQRGHRPWTVLPW